MEHRFATDEDLDMLAEWVHQLIQDEGHRNPKDVPELRKWLRGEHRTAVFTKSPEPVAYALHRASATEIYLRTPTSRLRSSRNRKDSLL